MPNEAKLRRRKDRLRAQFHGITVWGDGRNKQHFIAEDNFMTTGFRRTMCGKQLTSHMRKTNLESSFNICGNCTRSFDRLVENTNR